MNFECKRATHELFLLQVRTRASSVEGETSAATVAIVMKLSEMELRPLFLHLCEWKTAGEGDGTKTTAGALDRRLSFYTVFDGLAAALKVKYKIATLRDDTSRCGGLWLYVKP